MDSIPTSDLKFVLKFTEQEQEAIATIKKLFNKLKSHTFNFEHPSTPYLISTLRKVNDEQNSIYSERLLSLISDFLEEFDKQNAETS